ERSPPESKHSQINQTLRCEAGLLNRRGTETNSTTAGDQWTPTFFIKRKSGFADRTFQYYFLQTQKAVLALHQLLLLQIKSCSDLTQLRNYT
ncbi:hypothetical protein DVA76_18250, partial [Acinetobacter baumannii]